MRTLHGIVRQHWVGIGVVAVLWIVANLVAVRAALAGSYDWITFYGAASTVGTTALLGPLQHTSWELAHHLPISPFVYLPATAWFVMPAAHLPIVSGNIAFIAVMTLTAAAAGVVLGRIYGANVVTAIAGVFAWAPTTTGIIFGQQASFGLLFEALAIAGIVRGSWMLAGLSVGVLLYKPTDAIVFILLLVVRRCWRSLAVVGMCAVCWYAGSVAATAGDALWPWHYLQLLHGYYAADFAGNAAQAVSLPQLLMRAHFPQWVAFASAGIVFALAITKLSTTSRLEAASIAPLIGIAGSPHVWPHDLTLMLPTLFFVARSRSEIVLASYGLAAGWVFYPLLRFNPASVLVLGMAVYLLYARRRATVRTTEDPHYADRLQRGGAALWKRLLDVQRPYRWNLRQLKLGRVLDVGCGVGRNLAGLSLGSVGVDHNDRCVAFARARGLRAHSADAFYASNDAQAGAFDTLLFAHVLEHMEAAEADRLVRRYLPFMKREGRIVIITPQESGFRADDTHVRFVDFLALKRHADALGLVVDRAYSFPFPRWAGRLFPYNEFVFVGRRAG